MEKNMNLTLNNQSSAIEKIVSIINELIDDLKQSHTSILSNFEFCRKMRKDRIELKADIKDVLDIFGNLSEDAQSDFELKIYQASARLNSIAPKVLKELKEHGPFLFKYYLIWEVKENVGMITHLQKQLESILYPPNKEIDNDINFYNKLVDVWGDLNDEE
jgi:hypothetical protein